MALAAEPLNGPLRSINRNSIPRYDVYVIERITQLRVSARVQSRITLIAVGILNFLFFLLPFYPIGF